VDDEDRENEGDPACAAFGSADKDQFGWRAKGADHLGPPLTEESAATSLICTP